MSIAEFSEKAYEIAYDIELACGKGGHPLVYAPSQVLEKLTGFDAAANPDDSHVLWRVLRTPRPPGVHLLPNLWASSSQWLPNQISSLPSYPVSIVLQFKRPEYLAAPQSKQWHFWRRPYYRFTRTKHQQQTLGRLERRLTGQAVVRYAAPAFWQTCELEAAQLKGEVVARSGHVSPRVLARHKVWTYVRSGMAGRGNPGGDIQNFPLFDQLLRTRPPSNLPMVRTPDSTQFLFEHLRALGAASSEREPELRRAIGRWERELKARDIDLDLGPEAFDALLNYATAASLVAREGFSWWLVDGSEQEPIDSAGALKDAAG